jgi:predicted alpha/beta-fold hydrolase
VPCFAFALMITTSRFKPAWWLPGPHLQTLWPNLLRHPRVALRRERLELHDGDFLDLDWTTGSRGPVVVILHGLEGSSRSPYAAGLLNALHRRGWRGVVMHARGCSGEPNRLPRRYHAGDTDDLDYCLRELRRREPHTPLAAVGYSLGGSMLLNWLAETSMPRDIAAAVAVSVPFRLEATAGRLERGFSRLYQRALLRSVYRAVSAKHQVMNHPLARAIRPMPPTFRAFDDAYTAPLHGFSGVDDYYRRASCGPKLRRICNPVLILQASNDPFMDSGTMPAEEQLSEHVTLEVSGAGGHVGFVAGSPLRPRYWLEERIPQYLEGQLQPGPTTPSE